MAMQLAQKLLHFCLYHHGGTTSHKSVVTCFFFPVRVLQLKGYVLRSEDHAVFDIML